MNDIPNLCELVGANVQDVATMYLIFTEWGEVKAVKPYEYKKLMRTLLVYDGRNIYDIEDMKTEGAEYYSIGRPYVRKNGTVLAEAATAEDQDS